LPSGAAQLQFRGDSSLQQGIRELTVLILLHHQHDPIAVTCSNLLLRQISGNESCIARSDSDSHWSKYPLLHKFQVPRVKETDVGVKSSNFFV
jgi:hypothetical protein